MFSWLSPLLLTLQVISSISIIVLVLLQQGKGADMGAAFGSGSAGSVFGSAGAANFLSRATKWAAVIFFVTTGGLAWVAHHPAGSPIDSGVMQGFTSSAPAPAPAGSAGPSVPSTSGAAVPAPAAGAAVPSTTPDAAGQGAASVPAPQAGSTQPAQGDSSVPSVPAK
ncbi:MAG: preprotein translocase subunit SecG [Alcaligenaceae bacterium]|nr:preprotein translocase subunit SecG [Alcaligenaceae bacterium]